MATPPVTPVPAPVQAAAAPVIQPARPKETLLQRIGSFFKKIFHVAGEVGVAIEPVVDLAFPGIASLYNTTVALVANAEMTATAAGVQNGSGLQKAAMVIQALEPLFFQYAKTNNIPVDQTHLANYVDAVVATLNAFPAPVAPPSSSALAPTPAK